MDKQEEAGNLLSALGDSVKRGKRKTVPAACEACRSRKAKCSGKPPCDECVRRKLECVFVVEGNETRHQAFKRKYGDLTRSHDELQESHDRLEEMVNALVEPGENEAVELLQRLRNGETLVSILSQRQARRRPDDAHPDVRLQRARRRLIVAILQSNLRLDEVLNLASYALLPDNASNLPPDVAFDGLKEVLVTSDAINQLVVGQSVPRAIEDGFRNDTTFWVPADPWTTLIDHDTAVSVLISRYFIILNPYWRFVEQDIFLRAMRERRPSPYCSSLLVHAILAYSSMYTEIDEAFETPGNYLTRGHHYQQEAIRLWALESGRASVANIQALLVTAMTMNMRGQDAVGYEYTEKAVELHRALSAERQYLSSTPPRLQVCLEKAVTSLKWSSAFGMSQSFENIPQQAPSAAEDVKNTLPDTTVYWSMSPFVSEPKPLRLNLLMYERAQLVQFVHEIMGHFYSSKTASTRPYPVPEASAFISQRMDRWYDGLPSELRCSQNKSMPLFDFHAHYSTIRIGLCNRVVTLLTRNQQIGPAESSDSRYDRDRIRYQRACLDHAHLAAKIIRDFGQTYGYKIVPPLVCHSAAVALFVLVRELASLQQSSTSSMDFRESHAGQSPNIPLQSTPFASSSRSPQPSATAPTFRTFQAINHQAPTTTTATPGDSSSSARKDPPRPAAASIADIENSFEICFRCILTAGTTTLTPRAIARTIYHTAKQLHVRFPDSVQQMLRLVEDGALSPADLRQLRSTHPNYAIENGNLADAEGYSLDENLREWEKMERERRGAGEDVDMESTDVASSVSVVSGDAEAEGGRRWKGKGREMAHCMPIGLSCDLPSISQG